MDPRSEEERRRDTERAIQYLNANYRHYVLWSQKPSAPRRPNVNAYIERIRREED